MKKIYLLFLVALLHTSLITVAQTTFTEFTDNYNRGTLSPGGTPSLTYSTGGSSGTIATSGSSTLRLTVTGGVFSAANGTAYATVPLSGFGTPFRTTLNANAGTVTWTFNMRTDVASTGFASGSQMVSTVLVGTNAALNNTGTGYAVAFTTGANKGVQLIKYTAAGLQGANTAIITPTSNMISSATNYVSVRVTYVPSTNTWSLFLRDDGGTASVDPSSGVTTQVGSSAVDNTYTGTAMSVAGFIANYRAGAFLATQNATIDNFSCLVTCNAPTGVTATASTTAACTATPFSLSATGSGVSAWSWTGPAGSGYSSSLQNPASFLPALSSAGIYSLTATAASGCPAFATTGSVVVTATPTISVTTTSANYCVGSPAITLTASGTAASYVWTPNPGALSAYTGTVVSATPAVTTTYTVVGSNANCTDTRTQTITIIGTAPVFTMSPISSAIGCPGVGVSITASSPSSLTYTWTPATALSATTGATVTASPTATSTYTIVGTNGIGCADVRTSTINILGAVPTAPATSLLTNTSVHLTWTAVSGATGYTMKAYTDAGLTTLAASVNSATNSGDITTLTQNTTYWIIIVANMGVGCNAPNSPSVQITTPVGLPYWESFETISTQNAVPSGWLATANAGSYTPRYADAGTGGVAFHGTWDYRFIGNVNSNTNANNWLVSPGIPMVAGTTYNVSFNYNVLAGTNPLFCGLPGAGTGSITAYMSNNGTLPGVASTAMSGTVVTLLSTGTVQNTGWITPTTMTFTAPSTGNYYLGLRYVGVQTCSGLGTTNMSPDALIDNIRICKNPTAPASPLASPNPICATADLNLTSVLPATYNYYTWAGPGGFTATNAGSSGTGIVPAIAATGAGIYTVTVGSDPYYTCSANATTASVTVIPLPVTIVPADTVICAGGSYTLRGGNPSSGTAWSSAPSGNVSITSSGVATATSVPGIATPVTITYNNGCGTPATATVKTVNSLGGVYTVGAGQQFPTLSDAVSVYNCVATLTGPVTFQLTDASYPNEAYPIIVGNHASASSTNTLTIRPATGVSPTFSGSSTTSMININGKYITIEGSNSPVPNTICPSATSSQDITIVNTNTGTSSAVVWLGSGASNDTVRNCIIAGSGAAQTLIGIGSGGASIAVNSLGAANLNNAFVNNNISAVQNGIYSMGASAGSKNTGTVINQNTVSATSNNGILVGFESGISIQGNIITGNTSATAARDIVGINVGFASNGISVSTSSVVGNEVNNATIANNIVGSISSTATAGAQSAIGIALTGSTTGSNNTLANNAVYRVVGASTGSDITAGILLSGITSGIQNNVWYNTVNMNGSATGASNTPTYALAVTGVVSPVDVKNNILVNKFYNGTANAARSLGLAYTTYSSLTSNNNDLADSGSTNLVSVGSLTAPSANYASVAAWVTGSGSTQDVSSITALPTFNNVAGAVPDLGLSYAAANIAINNAGTPLAYATDINCATRDAANPDMGINEFNGSAPPPVIAYTAITATGNCPVNKTLTATITISGAAPANLDITSNAPRVYFSKDNITWFSNAGVYVSGSTAIGGTSTWNFTITAATMGLVGNETVYYYVVAQDQSAPAGVGSLPTGVVAANVNAITAAPTPNTYATTIASGIYYVGSGQDFSTLPLAIAAYNNSTCLSGPVVFKLTDATYNLSATALTINNNPLASTVNTLTIAPFTGVSPTITGAVTTGLITLNNAKYVTIEGSNNPVTNSICPAVVTSSRNMTIKNTSTGTASAVVWLAAGASNNTVRNCNVTGNSNSTTLIALGSGGSGISVSSLGSSNNNNTFENNNVSLAVNGIYSMGASSGAKNTGNVINQNLLNVSTGIAKNGIMVGYENNITISGNSVANIVSSATIDVVGINLGMGDNAISNSIAAAVYEVTNATVTYNKVDNISNSNATGYSAVGIVVGGAASGTNTIANNMVSGVWSKATSPDLWAGVYLGGAAGSTTNFYYNAIYLSGGTSGGTMPAFGLAVSGSNPTVNIINNIIVNNSSAGGTRSAMCFAYNTYSALTSASNDLYSSGGNLVGYGSLSAPTGYYTSIAAWNSASGKDAPPSYPTVTLPITTAQGSVSMVPAFTSTVAPVDLSVTTSAGNYLLNNTGTPVSPVVTTDFDCNLRSAATPDIGVNEFNPSGCTATDSGSVAASVSGYCVNGSPTLTLSTTTTGSGAYYQWQSSATGTGSWTSINGATSLTYTPFVTTTTYYRALVACLNVSATHQTQTVTAVVIIAPQPSISAVSVAPANLSICSGGNITLTGTTSGGYGIPTYTWSGPAITTTTGSLLTSPVLTPVALATTTGAYSLVVSYDGANCIASNPRATVGVYTVSPQPSVSGLSVLPVNTAICSGASVTLSAVPSGGAGSPTYTWSGPGLSATTGTSFVSPVLNPTTAATTTGAFSVTLGYSGTGCVTTAPFTTTSVYTVSPQPVITSLTPSTSGLCVGETLTLTSTASGGTGSPVYTWSGAAIATTTGTTPVSPVFAPVLAGTSSYSLSLAYPGTGCVTSVTSTTVTVNPLPAITLGGMPSICQPTTSPTVSFSGAVGSPTLYSIDWSSAANAVGINDVVNDALGASPITLAIPASGALGYYDGVVSVSNGSCVSAATYPVHVTIYANPTASVTSVDQVCSNHDGYIHFTGVDSASVNYTVDGGSVNTFVFSGSTTSLSTGTLTAPKTYIIQSAYNPVCSTAINDTFTVNPTPMAWVGGQAGHESEWAYNANWTCGFAPTVVDDVEIGSATYAPSIATSAVANTRNLKLSSGSALLINSGGVVNVKGTLDNISTVYGNGKLILNGSSAQTVQGIGTVHNLELDNTSGATIVSGSRLMIGQALYVTAGNLATNDSLELLSSDTFAAARIAELPSSGATITGKVKVDQYIQGGYRRFRFWSHPFSDTISLSQMQNYIDITGTGGSTNGFTTTGSNAASAFRFNTYTSCDTFGYDPGWKPFTKISVTAADSNKLHPYQGIRLFFRGVKNEGLGYLFGYTPSPVTVKQMGNVNQGDQIIMLARGATSYQEYNLIGNPYASPVDIGTILYEAQVSGDITGSAFYVWDPSVSPGGQYLAIDLGVGAPAPYYLQANAAFEVRAHHDGAILTFHESHKVATVDNYLFKAAPTSVSLNVYDVNYHLWDKLKLKFNEAATDNEDGKYDATKPMGTDFSFYSMSAEGRKLAIDARPYSADKVIPLGVRSGTSQDFIVRAENVVVPDNGTVYLHDKLLQKYVELTAGTEYYFTITNDKATQGDDRFEISMKPGATVATFKGLAVSMTPNPATDDVKISFTSGVKEEVEVRVLDMSGVSIYNENLGMKQSGVVNVPLSNFAAGIYMVELTQGMQKVTQKLVKE